MKFKTKLLVIFVGMTLLTNGIMFVIYYREMRTYLRQQLDAKALAIATTAAAIVDGDEIAAIQTPAALNTPAYKKYEQLLRTIRNNNRNDSTYIKYIYTLFPKPNQPQQLLFGVDAQEQGTDKSLPGETYQFNSKQPYVLSEATTQAGFLVDKWGRWSETHAPIYNKQGKLVGAVVVDVSDQIVNERLNYLLDTGYLANGSATIIALLLALFLARIFAKPLELIVNALKNIGNGDLTTRVAVKSQDEFGAVGDAINEMVTGLRQRDNLKMSLTRYVSHQVVNKVIETGTLPEVQGERRKITVLFCDIRDFTTLAESLPPEEVVSLLNEAFALMIDAVFKHQGMLDKFLGDGFMAIFGAPLDDIDQAQNAINTALTMQTALDELTARWRLERHINFRVGIGINTGIAIVGNIGSYQRMEYTAIGDTVNLASRLESATKTLGIRILVSESTYLATAGLFKFIKFGAIQVKGRKEPVNVYALDETVLN